MSTDKIKQIESLLEQLDDNDLVSKIKTLLSGCSDNSQVVIAYDRQQLNDYIWSETNKEYSCTDEEWKDAWESIQDDDTAWGYMSDACYEAECNLFDKLDDEGRLPK